MNLNQHTKPEVISLLSYRMIYEYPTKKIAEEINTETLDYFMKDLGNCYEDLNLSRADMRSVWKEAIQVLAADGTILPTELPASIQLSTMDHLVSLLCKAINAID